MPSAALRPGFAGPGGCRAAPRSLSESKFSQANVLAQLGRTLRLAVAVARGSSSSMTAAGAGAGVENSGGNWSRHPCVARAANTRAASGSLRRIARSPQFPVARHSASFCCGIIAASLALPRLALGDVVCSLLLEFLVILSFSPSLYSDGRSFGLSAGAGRRMTRIHFGMLGFWDRSICSFEMLRRSRTHIQRKNVSSDEYCVRSIGFCREYVFDTALLRRIA